jgi:hypothetical protein
MWPVLPHETESKVGLHLSVNLPKDSNAIVRIGNSGEEEGVVCIDDKPFLYPILVDCLVIIFQGLEERHGVLKGVASKGCQQEKQDSSR